MRGIVKKKGAELEFGKKLRGEGVKGKIKKKTGGRGREVFLG